jgi:hypothetical protein
MDCYISLDSKSIPLVGPVSFSTGDGLDVSQRYGYDYSRAPQSLVHRKRTTALTASVNLSFAESMCADAGAASIYDYIDDLQNTVGARVNLFWNGRNFGSFVVVSAQVTASVDAVQPISAASVALSLTEGYVRRETLQTEVRTL